MLDEHEIENLPPSDIISHIEEFFTHYEDGKYRKLVSLAYSRAERHISIQFEDILSFSPYLANSIRDNPNNHIPDFIEVFRNLLERESANERFNSEELEVRITTSNNSNEVRLRDLRIIHLNKLVYIKALCIRIKAPQPLITRAEFECKVCQSRHSIPQTSDVLIYPEVCSNPNCTVKSKKNFTLIHERSEFVDHQKIMLQELPEDLDGGVSPRSITAYLKLGLVDSIRAGERVRVMAISRSRPIESNKGKETVEFSPFLLINSVDSVKIEEEDEDLTPKDVQEIRNLASNPNIVEILINSLSPAIYGNDHLKLAALLSLFGGVDKITTEGQKIRGLIHVLFMGDPSTGKSQILRFCAKCISPNVFTGGKGASAAGLTAAVIREKDSSTYSLEAGALVLASGGVALIDEFDKMERNDRSAIHEAMEQLSISISKAGINATLPTRTSIIAAANPRFGRYNAYKPPSENINLPSPILSRFDLIFIVQDTPNKDKDKAIAGFIINTHLGNEDKEENTINQSKNVSYIKVPLLKKYIRYARNNCKPILTKPAAKLIEEFYLSLRELSRRDENSPIAIVARYLEALIRMSEAFAKMALRDHVIESDARRSIELMRRSIQEIGLDSESGQLDIDKLITGSTKGNQEKYEVMLRILNEMEQGSLCGKDGVKIADFIAQVREDAKYPNDFIYSALEKLEIEGFIHKPHVSHIRILR